MKNLRFAILLAGAVCLCIPAQAVVEERTVADLTAEARQIIVGDVVEINCFWDDNHDLIKSRVTVVVSDYLVGEGDGVEEFVLSGGTVDGLSLEVSVLPVFHEGDHVILFLGDSEIRLVQVFQGAYLSDGQDIARMAPACARVIEETLQPLDSFLAEIEQALPAGQKVPALKEYAGDFTIPIGMVDYGLCGQSWAYKANPMGEDIKINGNCADSSAGDAASQIAQILNGTDAWTNAGADFAFTYGGTSTQTSVSYNGTNLYYFDLTPPDGGDYVAANYRWFSGSNISENDIVFNDADYGWWNGSSNCFNKMDIWNIATHESGHSLCLLDLYGGGDSDKTMYGYVSYCDTHARTLHSDDINGIIAIYGGGGGGGYCDAASDSTSYEYIERVQVGTINRSSGSDGYADYTGTSTDMEIGTGYSITVTLDTEWSSDIGGLWVDWNQDEDFSDSGETITVSWSGLGPYTTTITPPGSAAVGTTRMRVRIQDGDYDPTPSSCGTSDYGEVEDYSIHVSDSCTNPVFIVQPEPSQYICEGDFAVLSVAVDTPSPTYQWRKGTVNLIDDGYHISGALMPNLYIINFGPADVASNYNCVVTNTDGGCSSTSNNAALHIDSNVAEILTQPQDQEVTAGDFVTISVVIENPILFDFQWRRNGANLSDNGRISGTETSSMQIYPVELGDAGNFDCVITSGTGGHCSVTSDDAVLTVNPAQDCPGDLNGDNVVDLSDLAELLAHYGMTSGAGEEDGDMDGDGDVDLGDLAALLAVYGTTC